MRIINRIENENKCKAVYRVHADRAQELTGDRHRTFLENSGITVTSTAGYDSNANGRAERAVLCFLQKGTHVIVIGYSVGSLSEETAAFMDIRSSACRRKSQERNVWRTKVQ